MNIILFLFSLLLFFFFYFACLDTSTMDVFKLEIMRILYIKPKKKKVTKRKKPNNKKKMRNIWNKR